MVNNNYVVRCINQELEIFTVYKKSEDKTYTLTKQEDGGFAHQCKAILVYGPNYLCRHKKLVLKEFYATKAGKSIFNISPKRNSSINGKSADS